MREDLKGDFLGFSFDNIHSSRLGIVRVANGDRYTEELFPEVSDRTHEITGEDGENYYGSEFKTKVHTINIAFDSVTEKQFRQLRKLFGTKKICPLIFDERPYKVYMAKIESPIELEYVCFDEHKRHEGETIEGGGIRYVEKDGERVKEDITPWVYEYDEGGRPITERIYKGEGTIELISYYPYAHQLYKQLELYTDNPMITTYSNVDEWAESSGILDTETFTNNHIDEVLEATYLTNYYNLQIPVYNPGDLDTGFYLYIPFDNSGHISPAFGNYVCINGDTNGLLLREIERKGDDSGIIINTNNHLIEGVKYDFISERNDYRTRSWTPTINIYNEYIAAGDFPLIKRSDWHFDDTQYKQSIYLNCQVADRNSIKLDYDYLYF